MVPNACKLNETAPKGKGYQRSFMLILLVEGLTSLTPLQVVTATVVPTQWQYP